VSDLTLRVLTRGASDVISRRGTLFTLAPAALFAAAHSELATANKKTKKIKTKKCKQQVGQCTASLEEVCQGNEECQANIASCGLLANCNAAAALPCIFINAA
jgi:hypothetical protein